MRILETMVSGIPLVLGPKPESRILIFMRSLGPLHALALALSLLSRDYSATTPRPRTKAEMFFLQGVLLRLLTTGQIMVSSKEVTMNSSYCWENTKTGLNSGSGIIVICPLPYESSCKASIGHPEASIVCEEQHASQGMTTPAPFP